MTSEPTVSWRNYVDSRFETQDRAVAAALAAQEKAVAAALAAADRAVAKAEAAAERRFESVNEFRAALNDNARLLMPRSEAEQSTKTLNEKLEVLTARLNAREERGRGMGDIWGYLIGAIGLIALIISFFRG